MRYGASERAALAISFFFSYALSLSFPFLLFPFLTFLFLSFPFLSFPFLSFPVRSLSSPFPLLSLSFPSVPFLALLALRFLSAPLRYAPFYSPY